MKTPLLLGFLMFACVWAVPARTDVDVAVSADIRIGKVPPPPPPVIEVIEVPVHHGPPPWAPASGFRRNRAYYYYPGCNVYYRPADHVWFFMDGGDWRFGVHLPAEVRVDFTRSVSLSMETDRPYLHHAHVETWYPGDYFTKVKIRDEHRHEEPRAEKAEKKERAVEPSDAAPKEEGRGKKKHDEPGADHGKGRGKKK